jgi:hypothetical protein
VSVVKDLLKAPFEDPPVPKRLFAIIPESPVDRSQGTGCGGDGEEVVEGAAATASVHSGEEKRGGVVIRTATDDCAHGRDF